MATVKFYAAARQFAKTKEIKLEVKNKFDLESEFKKIGDLDLTKLAQISTFLVNGKRYSLNEITEIFETDIIEVLPPFAGG
jgi:molybdopterin converting factor small subunit